MTYSAFTRFIDTLSNYVNNPSQVDPDIVNALNNIGLVAGRVLTKKEINDLVLNTIEAANQMEAEFRSIADNLADYFQNEATHEGISQQDLTVSAPNSITFKWQEKGKKCFSKPLRGLHFKWTNLMFLCIRFY